VVRFEPGFDFDFVFVITFSRKDHLYNTYQAFIRVLRERRMTTMNSENHQSQSEYQPYSEYLEASSAEAEYVERRRTQNRIAQRNYRKWLTVLRKEGILLNSFEGKNLHKRQAENKKESKEAQATPANDLAFRPSVTQLETDSHSGTHTPYDRGSISVDYTSQSTPLSSPPISDLSYHQAHYGFPPADSCTYRSSLSEMHPES